ncbi:hypothetical protein Xsto_03684 [Xenorhabdus stockiae]|uniref:Uncharacterized protein n=1 Tax=Xenorhabdus stockiae TaxID=351614 RepID=A0A2D0KBK1_9GAMM|nr:hypothetical protein Xsto_03684 [Xenorhabdus stockiae]
MTSTTAPAKWIDPQPVSVILLLLAYHHEPLYIQYGWLKAPWLFSHAMNSSVVQTPSPVLIEPLNALAEPILRLNASLSATSAPFLFFSKRVFALLFAALARSYAAFTAFGVAAWVSLLLSTALFRMTNPFSFSVASGWLRLFACFVMELSTYSRVARTMDGSTFSVTAFALLTIRIIRIV